MRGQTPRWHWLALAGGALFSATCLVCALCWNAIFDSVIAAQMRLVPGSEAYEKWRESTLPLYQDIYMFNWTNADKFPEEKPMMQELGPYRYREYRKQVNISYTSQNDTLGYRTLKRWQYEPEPGTNLTLDDNITMVNVITASAVYRSRYWDFFRQKGVSMGLAMFGQKISVSKLVRELLFDGYEDPLLDLAKSLPESVTGGAPRVDRFGLFYGRNDSVEEDGYHEVTTGRHGLPGQILKWNGKDHLPFFEGQCSKLEGTVGGFYPRNVTAESAGYIKMFMSQLCRSVTLKYDGSGIMRGVPYNKFAFYEGTFDNSSTRPENACFCNGPCSWSGIMNISACSFGSPSFLSLPHFLHGSRELQRGVGGMRPDTHKHDFYFKISSTLGVPVEVAGRFQFNVLMEPSENIALYSQVPRMLMPVFWVEQRFKMSDEIIADMLSAQNVAEWGGVLCAVLAACSAALVATAAAWIRRQEKMAAKKLALETQMDEAEIKLNPDKRDFQ